MLFLRVSDVENNALPKATCKFGVNEQRYKINYPVIYVEYVA